MSSNELSVLETTADKACVVLFARVPVAGRVKTRLIPELGADGACRLHEYLLSQALQLLESCDFCSTQLWLDDTGTSTLLDKWNGLVYQQQGSDLGERMCHAFGTQLVNHEFMLLIGSDCPALSREYLQAALSALSSGVDLVLGPAADGGYVLIGLKKNQPALFRHVAWGTDQVLARTLAIAEELGLSTILLDTLVDIDRPEDLAVLPAGFAPVICRSQSSV